MGRGLEGTTVYVHKVSYFKVVSKEYNRRITYRNFPRQGNGLLVRPKRALVGKAVICSCKHVGVGTSTCILIVDLNAVR